jgi:hypothetical protein
MSFSELLFNLVAIAIVLFAAYVFVGDLDAGIRQIQSIISGY